MRFADRNRVALGALFRYPLRTAMMLLATAIGVAAVVVLTGLGEAARLEQPDAESIRRMSSFVDPYDPLVSFFAHHEAAYLLSRTADPNPAA